MREENKLMEERVIGMEVELEKSREQAHKAKLRAFALDTLIQVADETYGFDLKKLWVKAVKTGCRQSVLYTKKDLYTSFGYTRQAYYQGLKRGTKETALAKDKIQIARDIKALSPGIGTEKLRLVSQTMFPDMDVHSRDRYHALMREHGLTNKRRKGKSTTNSNHRFRKYKFLAKGVVPRKPNVLCVSDITNIALQGNDRCYLHLTTDVYSRKIVGWCLSPTLHAEYTLSALWMAVDSCPEGTDFTHLIHHSDRGIQYCCDEYTKYFHSLGIQISMTQDGNPLDNAIAERVNRILKGEAIERVRLFSDINEAREKIGSFIEFYNNRRPHRSIGMSTPNKIYGSQMPEFLN